MLYARDKHQLFELLCLQLSLIILAYREGIKEITTCVDGDDEYYKPEEFLNCMLPLTLLDLLIIENIYF